MNKRVREGERERVKATERERASKWMTRTWHGRALESFNGFSQRR